MTTTRLPYIDYYLTMRRAKTSSGKGNDKTLLVSYTTLKHVSKNGKVPTIVVGNTKSN